jgi:Protein kinase domain
MEKSDQPKERNAELNKSINGFDKLSTTDQPLESFVSMQHDHNESSNHTVSVNAKELNVSVSQEKQLEVYNILAMIQGTASDDNDSKIRVKDDNAKNSKKTNVEFEGEYNSCDEDGTALSKDGADATAVVTATPNCEYSIKKTTTKQQNSALQGNTSSGASRYYFGKPKQVQSIGKFTELGSILGPFFCLGQLGKGTFSSIHKCICMNYFHRDNNSTARRRLAAAKVELVSFQQSGVLEAEATILDYLHNTLPPGTVPVYMGHYRSDPYAAIFMEYLPGEDMHQLRERVMAKTAEDYELSRDDDNVARTNRSPPTRRINAADAVYLTAEVMLPLLQRMHEVGVVHRDVKPSNCVRAGTGSQSKQFCMVDFGLSKSIIVPEDNEFADKEHYWNGKYWLKPYLYQNMENPPRGCYRQERKKADFRGTSMYASLRVHQERDYCPRDDVWSLLYVFCDLVSGGLPWMQHAANRDRDACQRYKERIHGESEDHVSGDIAELLKGDIYEMLVCLKKNFHRCLPH